MSTLDDQILTAVRRWLLQATGLDGSRIRPADDSGTRPDLPYITIRTLLQGTPTSRAELRSALDVDGEIVENVRAPMTGTIQLDAYGRGGDEYLTIAAMSLQLTTIKQLLADEKIGLNPEGGINDLSALVDDAIEKRFSQDYLISYTLEFDEPTTGTEAMQTLEGSFEFDDQTFDVDA